MNNGITFSAIIEMWQNRYQDARPGTEVVKARQSAEFIQKQPDLEIEFNNLKPFSERFLSFVTGRDHGRTAIEQAASVSLCFFPRIFGIATVDNLPATLAGRLSDSLRDSFFLGMACHFVLMNNPNRIRIREVNFSSLFEEFLKESITAEIKMRTYNNSSNNIPRDVFNAQFNIIESFVKDDLHIGFWKRGKLQSNYYNLFCSGILLPMMTEIRASNL